MKRKKILRITLYFFTAILVLLVCLIAYSYYWIDYKYVPSENKFTQRVAYINPDEALFSEGFETCGDYIFDYYNPERATYSKGKNGLRDFILKNYKNRNYSESGYLNFRFVINCKGKAGRYVIHENDLDLIPKQFSEDLKNQLLDLTVQLKEWNPNVIRGMASDSYMYISYRIENGAITEIIP